MEVFYGIIMFILGAILGSFYNVVGFRLPKGESIVFPPSHCPNCNNRLGASELIPIFSFIFQKGKCKHCKKNIPIFYTVSELITGILFTLAYLIYGLTPDLIIPITFISMLVIIVVSDYNYMIISDSVLLTFGIIIGLEILFINGFNDFFSSLVSAILSFFTMWALKKFGDLLFKKESMGGGDIKLMAIFGLVLGFPMTIFSIFLGSLIGLPISLFMLKKNTDHIIPFGPFLAMSAVIIVLSQLDFTTLKTFLGYI